MFRQPSWSLCAVLWLLGSACDSVLGLTEFRSASDAISQGQCSLQQQCPGSADSPDAKYCTARQSCRVLRSQDCTVVAGPERDDDAVLIGSLFEARGGMDASELARQNAARLAVDEINEGGGIPTRVRAMRGLYCSSLAMRATTPCARQSTWSTSAQSPSSVRRTTCTRAMSR
jgi:hypothetical protein